jgi:predicted GIY-YIG superfamily endonuclease
MCDYFVYIMSNPSRTLYVGVTNDLERRVWQHKEKLQDGFTKRYNITLLVYAETFPDPGQEGRAHRVPEPDVAGSERRVVPIGSAY